MDGIEIENNNFSGNELFMVCLMFEVSFSPSIRRFMLLVPQHCYYEMVVVLFFFLTHI